MAAIRGSTSAIPNIAIVLNRFQSPPTVTSLSAFFHIRLDLPKGTTPLQFFAPFFCHLY
jgi:hypothetical protein